MWSECGFKRPELKSLMAKYTTWSSPPTSKARSAYLRESRPTILLFRAQPSESYTRSTKSISARRPCPVHLTGVSLATNCSIYGLPCSRLSTLSNPNSVQDMPLANDFTTMDTWVSSRSLGRDSVQQSHRHEIGLLFPAETGEGDETAY